jgi:hypothetical protein
LSDATYVDIPFEVDSSTLKLDGILTWDITDTGAGVGLPDLDFLLFDPNGNEIASSGNSDAPEHISANTTIPGTYIWRVYGWANGPTDFTVESTQLKGGAAPVVQPFASDFTKENLRHDFDGNYTLNWTPRGAVENYEIEQSTDGNNWTVVGFVDGNTTSGSFSNMADGTYQYRVRAVTAGRVGKFVTVPSNVESIKVSRRAEVDATDSIAPVNRTITFPAGATELVTALKNQSTTVFYPNMRLEIVSIQSSGNSVKVANADNQGDGIATPAVFDYSQLVGDSLAANAESGNKMLRFSNPNTVLFSFTARVKANVLAGSAAAGATASGSTATGSGTTASGTTTGGTTTNATGSALTSRLLKFTVNPITKTVNVTILQ